MKKKTNRFFYLIMLFSILFSYFSSIVSVFAISSTTSFEVSFRENSLNHGKVTYSLDDGASWLDITNNANINITVLGDNLRIKIVPDQNYSVDYAGIEMTHDDNEVGGLSTIGFESNNGYFVPSDVESVKLLNVEFRHDDGPSGNDTSNYQGNATSTLNYSINGVIEYTSGGGFDHGISFRINDLPYCADESKMNYTEEIAYERDHNGNLIIGNNNQPIPILDPETNQQMTEKTALTITGDTINYDYDTSTNKVNFVFTMAPGTLMTGLVINNQTINSLPKTSSELQAHYTDHRLEIPVNDIPKADTYNIEITARYPNSSEEFMGNFLWDYNPEGYTSPDDKILNGTMVFVKAEYEGHVYTTPEEVNALGGVYIWQDAPRQDSYTEEREGCGEAQFPKGTMLTVKIIPDAGYQLVDFGINGGVFAPQEEIGTYSFEVAGGPFHLQATIQPVDDVVNTNSEKISAGAINLGEEQSMAVGTARLDVNDVQLSDDQINNFKEAANGYTVKDYLDISLFNTVYKGSSTDSWDTEVKDLDNEAEIFLQLEEDSSGEDIVIIHEKGDGTYEVIPTEYLDEYNAISFKTKSFSNYAIATKPAAISTGTNPHTGDNIMIYFIMLGLSIIGLSGVGIYSKKRLFNK